MVLEESKNISYSNENLNLSFGADDEQELLEWIASSTSQMSDLVALYKTKIDALKSQLADSQIYLNMIVHDMRSPTHAIKLGLEATLD